MSKIGLISTSTSSMDYLDVSDKNLRIARMKILMDGKEYNDFVELSAEAFYQTLKENNSLVPSSAMPAIGEVFELVEEFEQKGYEEVIIITISSQLSGTFDMCKMVQKQYEGNMKIHVLDSRNAAISEGFINLEALRLINEGKSSAEIIAYLEKLRVARKQYFMVDNLRLFVANGRLSGASGFIGSMLKIKPILEVNDDGKIVSLEKIRTQKKALERMVEIILEDVKNLSNFVLAFISSDNAAGVEYVKERVLKLYPDVRFFEAPITPVVGCHTGVGTVGVSYFNLDI